MKKSNLFLAAVIFLTFNFQLLTFNCIAQVPTASFTASPITGCTPLAVNFTNTSIGATSYLWNFGNGATSTMANPTCYYFVAGNYTVTLIASGTGGNDTAITSITLNPLPIANAGSDQTICFGDTVDFTNNSTGAISYLWNFGDGSTSAALNPKHLYATAGNHSVALVVTNSSGCTASDTAIVSVKPSKDIYGHVVYSGGNVTIGNVVIYQYKQFQTHFDTIQVAPLNANGNYHFTGINHGNYIIKIFANTTNYPTVIPTYYGLTFLWNDPSVIIIPQNCIVNDTLNITTMIEVTGTGGGIGLLIGQIIQGLGFGRAEGEPIPGVDVKLGKNPGGSIAATTTTNGTGHYTFSGVANGNYTIYVDIPGLGRDSSYTFTVDANHNQFLHMDYKADSAKIHINPYAVGISNLDNADENKFRVYPNPSNGMFTIVFGQPELVSGSQMLKQVQHDVLITNVLGEKIYQTDTSTPLSVTKQKFEIDLSNQPKGIYFLQVTDGNKNVENRKIVLQ